MTAVIEQIAIGVLIEHIEKEIADGNKKKV